MKKQKNQKNQQLALVVMPIAALIGFFGVRYMSGNEIRADYIAVGFLVAIIVALAMYIGYLKNN